MAKDNSKKTKKRKKGFLKGPKSQWFFNFAYSIGAAIVIWGALFKILHLPGGSTLLCIGMGTEIAMFIITAFDRPSRDYEWEQVFPEFDEDGRYHPELAEGEEYARSGGRMRGAYAYAGAGPYYGSSGYAGSSEDNEDYQPREESEDYETAQPVMDAEGEASAVFGTPAQGVFRGAVPAGGGGGGVIIAGGGGSAEASTSSPLNISEEDTVSLRESIEKMAVAADQLSKMADLTTATQDYLEKISGIADQMTRLHETTAELNDVSSILLDSYKAITQNSETISESSNGYVERMADLNRNIGGLNTIYEIQLKSISSQLESIDRVNRGLKDIRDMYEKSARQSSRYCEETERMTRYMTQLNSVYEKMVTAMTINMYNPVMGQPQAAPQATPQPQQQPREEDFNPYAES